jgi:arylsulfatase A-like enzyme
MSDQPNILLLFTDQQRIDTIAACGHDHMVTPNLDRLVNEGCCFTNGYTPNPVCVPARHNALTGLPARFHGFPSNGGTYNHALPKLPQLLADHGYDTRAIGKMHFRPTRCHNGFNRMELMEEIPVHREDDDYAMYLKSVGLGHIQNIHGVRNLLYMAPQQSLIPEEHHGSTWVGDRSVDYLRQEAGRRPFFLWSSWIAPHPPFDVPDTFANLYDGRDLPEPLISETPLNPIGERSHVHADLPAGKEKAIVRRMRELYYAAVSHVDKNVGKILDALEETGELDNTLIIYTTDHGEMLGDHGCFQKIMPYDSCARIPFIVRYPKRFAPGSTSEEFVGLNDILPTVLDLCGIEYPGPHKLPGGSLLRDGMDRSHSYSEYGEGAFRWVSVRNARYKYSYYYAGGHEELFDMIADPCESRNLFACGALSGDLAEIRDDLRTKLIAWEKRWGYGQYVVYNQFVRFPPITHARTKNGQFPKFPDNIADPAEKAAMNDFGQEVIDAVKDESLLNLHELDLDSWAANGAPLETIERIRQEEL